MFKDDDEEDENSFGVVRYPCMPSLVALQQMRNRLHLAYLGRKLMKWTALATGREMRRLAQELYDSYMGFGEDLRYAFIMLARSRYFCPPMNSIVLEDIGKKAGVMVQQSGKTISGVKIVQFEIFETDQPPYPHLGLEKGGQTITETKKVWLELLKRLIMMMQLRASFLMVELAHKNANKKWNVLAKMVIPRINLSCHYIVSELEEIEREDNFRLKRFKELKIKKQKANEVPDSKIIPETPAGCCESCLYSVLKEEVSKLGDENWDENRIKSIEFIDQRDLILVLSTLEKEIEKMSETCLNSIFEDNASTLSIGKAKQTHFESEPKEVEIVDQRERHNKEDVDGDNDCCRKGIEFIDQKTEENEGNLDEDNGCCNKLSSSKRKSKLNVDIQPIKSNQNSKTELCKCEHKSIEFIDQRNVEENNDNSDKDSVCCRIATTKSNMNNHNQSIKSKQTSKTELCKCEHKPIEFIDQRNADNKGNFNENNICSSKQNSVERGDKECCGKQSRTKSESKLDCHNQSKTLKQDDTIEPCKCAQKSIGFIDQRKLESEANSNEIKKCTCKPKSIQFIDQREVQNNGNSNKNILCNISPNSIEFIDQRIEKSSGNLDRDNTCCRTPVRTKSKSNMNDHNQSIISKQYTKTEPCKCSQKSIEFIDQRNIENIDNLDRNKECCKKPSGSKSKTKLNDPNQSIVTKQDIKSELCECRKKAIEFIDQRKIDNKDNNICSYKSESIEFIDQRDKKTTSTRDSGCCRLNDHDQAIKSKQDSKCARKSIEFLDQRKVEKNGNLNENNICCFKPKSIEFIDQRDTGKGHDCKSWRSDISMHPPRNKRAEMKLVSSDKCCSTYEKQKTKSKDKKRSCEYICKGDEQKQDRLLKSKSKLSDKRNDINILKPCSSVSAESMHTPCCAYSKTANKATQTNIYPSPSRSASVASVDYSCSDKTVSACDMCDKTEMTSTEMKKTQTCPNLDGIRTEMDKSKTSCKIRVVSKSYPGTPRDDANNIVLTPSAFELLRKLLIQASKSSTCIKATSLPMSPKSVCASNWSIESSSVIKRDSPSCHRMNKEVKAKKCTCSSQKNIARPPSTFVSKTSVCKCKGSKVIGNTEKKRELSKSDCTCTKSKSKEDKCKCDKQQEMKAKCSCSVPNTCSCEQQKQSPSCCYDTPNRSAKSCFKSVSTSEASSINQIDAKTRDVGTQKRSIQSICSRCSQPISSAVVSRCDKRDAMTITRRSDRYDVRPLSFITRRKPVCHSCSDTELIIYKKSNNTRVMKCRSLSHSRQHFK